MGNTERIVFFGAKKGFGFSLESKWQECLKENTPQLFVTLDCPKGYIDTLFDLHENDQDKLRELISQHIKEVIQQN